MRKPDLTKAKSAGDPPVAMEEKKEMRDAGEGTWKWVCLKIGYIPIIAI